MSPHVIRPLTGLFTFETFHRKLASQLETEQTELNNAKDAPAGKQRDHSRLHRLMNKPNSLRGVISLRQRVCFWAVDHKKIFNNLIISKSVEVMIMCMCWSIHWALELAQHKRKISASNHVSVRVHRVLPTRARILSLSFEFSEIACERFSR